MNARGKFTIVSLDRGQQMFHRPLLSQAIQESHFQRDGITGLSISTNTSLIVYVSCNEGVGDLPGQFMVPCRLVFFPQRCRHFGNHCGRIGPKRRGEQLFGSYGLIRSPGPRPGLRRTDHDRIEPITVIIATILCP